MLNTDYTKEHLNKAKMAEFLWVAESEDAKGFAEELTNRTIEYEAEVDPRDRKRRRVDHLNFQRAVAAFAADLLHHSLNHDSLGFMYRHSNRSDFEDTFVSHRSFDQLKLFWSGMSLMEITKSIQVKQTWEGEATDAVFYSKACRFRGLPALFKIAEKYGIEPATIKEHFKREFSKFIPVTIKDERYDRKGWRIRPTKVKIKGKRYDLEAERVRELNAYLATSGFDLTEPPRVYRLFNRGNLPTFDFNMGGRLYCCSEDNWQSMNRERRPFITCAVTPDA
ncbi:hypothetical protein LAZ29_02720, partial [Cereibacter sphaeroides]|uniref:hypothetical protein n=1 Tax=Cereibacter sphaeroides TaxID=1063 RepID=UPI001F250D3E